jgi:hypothetical protein
VEDLKISEETNKTETIESIEQEVEDLTEVVEETKQTEVLVAVEQETESTEPINIIRMSGMTIKFPQIFTTSTPAEIWIKRYISYAKAAELKEASYVDALKALLDDATLEKFDSVVFTDDEAKDLNKITEQFTRCFTPITLETQLRYEFTKRTQLRNETLEAFAQALQRLVKNAYKSRSAEMQAESCRDQFVQGVIEPYIKESLLKETPATLELALKSAKTAALARSARTDLIDESCVLRVSDDNEAVRSATNTTATNVNNALVEELQSIRQQMNFMQRKQDELLNQASRASFSHQQPSNSNYNQIGARQQPRNAYGDQPSTYNNHNNNSSRPNGNTAPYRNQQPGQSDNNSFRNNNTSVNKPQNPNGIRCFNCGETGHIARDCSNNHLNYNGRRN